MPLEKLSYFLGNYFYQSFDVYFGDVSGAIRGFVLEEDEDTVVRAIGGLAILLASHADEDMLEEYMVGKNCEYHPVGETRREWLQSVADRMAAAALERWPM